ncbi:MAG: sulfatase [Planctomycetota bacterium]|nr:sulfatase [Planctomycetota bacterium]
MTWYPDRETVGVAFRPGMRLAILGLLFHLLAGSLLVAADRPNILLAISDDQSFPHASIYGDHGVSTPAFDRIAREGLLFQNAFSSSPGCSPSRASLLTGRYTWQLEHAGTHASSFSSRFACYPDLLQEAGYHVGYTGKPWGPGNWKAGGRAQNPAGPAFSGKTLQGPASGISNKDYAGNFRDFLQGRSEGQPFCFWYGAHEPHRRFEEGSGLRLGKSLEDATVPSFLPDTPLIRSDILDYYIEIEHFDRQLGAMLTILEETGELENTLVIVTSDNGMAFPRAKANCFEFGFHVPLAIRWPAMDRQPGRQLDDLVSFVDIAPTLLEAAGVKVPAEMVGRSLMGILRSRRDGLADRQRVAVYGARERHSSSRYGNLAYPQRALRTQDYLLIHNFRPDRWPAGAPQKLNSDGTPGPMHGGYHDIDACPSLTFLIEGRQDPERSRFFHLAVDRRPEFELYDIRRDPGCLQNLYESPEHAVTASRLTARLDQHLRASGDPRAIDGGDIFETYKRYSSMRRFPKPERP